MRGLIEEDMDTRTALSCIGAEYEQVSEVV